MDTTQTNIAGLPHLREVGYMRVIREKKWDTGAHKDYHEMVIVLEGEYLVNLLDGTQTLNTGDVIYYPPNTWHAPVNYMGAAQAICWIQWTENEPLFQEPYHQLGHDTRLRVTGIATRMLAFWPPSAPAEQLLLDAYLYALLFEYKVLEHEEGGNQIVALTRMYILNNMADTITVSDLAKYARMSLSQYAHQFTAQTGISPMAYARNMRINAAKPLLLNTMLSIPVIAKRSGFAHPTHFSRVFRQLVGVSPRHYRAHGVEAVNAK